MKDRRREITYKRIPHDATDEVHAARSAQLSIRLWELGLIHDAVLAIDQGVSKTNLNTSTPSLDQFTNRLHVHEPGSIIFGGHSFGATTVVQFFKSVYYAGSAQVASMDEPLYTPSRDSSICKQITPKNVLMLLDMWCFPLLAKSTKALFDLPLPAYADDPSAPGGNGIVAVESDSFYKWKEHLHATARILSPDPSAAVVETKAFERPSGIKLSEPNFFYVHDSAHLNQSDFGVLFPWLTKKIFNSGPPERVLRLNMRAMLQALRVNNVPIGRTSCADLVDGSPESKLLAGTETTAPGEKRQTDGTEDDKAIFDRGGNSGVEAWSWIDIVGMGDKLGNFGVSKDVKTNVEAQEPEMADEIEPKVVEGDTIKTAVSTAA